ncbi:MAG: hypothetical protein ACE5FN_03500 [Leptospirillia bacterium]
MELRRRIQRILLVVAALFVSGAAWLILHDSKAHLDAELDDQVHHAVVRFSQSFLERTDRLNA